MKSVKKLTYTETEDYLISPTLSPVSEDLNKWNYMEAQADENQIRVYK